MAQQYNVTIQVANLGDLAANYRGQISKGFKRLIWKACKNTRSLILIEDIDLFFPRHGQETRDASLAAYLNELVQQNKVMLVATTRRPDHVALDIRVLFQDEISLQIPTPEERFYMMQHIYQSSFNLAAIKETEIRLLSSKAHAFVAADLAQWCRLAEEDAIVHQIDQGTFLNETWRLCHSSKKQGFQ